MVVADDSNCLKPRQNHVLELMDEDGVQNNGWEYVDYASRAGVMYLPVLRRHFAPTDHNGSHQKSLILFNLNT